MEEYNTSPETALGGKDLWDARICRAFFSGYCPEGSLCKLKHIQPIREVVCKQFLLYSECKKGPLCVYLHEIIPEKLPECRNFNSDSGCSNPDCKFKHPTIKKENKECAYYNMGFCDQGKFCKFKHVRRDLCYEYVELNRCTLESCKKFHLKNIAEEYLAQAFYKLHPELKAVEYEKSAQYCPKCLKFGHSSNMCTEIGHDNGIIRCFKCGNYGHKANRCSLIV
jgi:cleavage and polyadenylation specificity factor subunit 4